MIAIMKKRVLFVLSSHSQFGDTGEKTGWWMGEAAHPWKVLSQMGYIVDFVSPQGGEPPVTGADLNDPVNYEFMHDPVITEKLKTTMKPGEVVPNKYHAILFVGGHGAIFDLPDNKEIARIAAHIYEKGGIVAAVCHGPAGLLNIRLSNGEYFIHGRHVTGFSDCEEREIKRCNDVPFLLQCELMFRGAHYHIAENWKPNIQVDDRLVTGQNPQSAKGVGEALLALLQKLDK